MTNINLDQHLVPTGNFVIVQLADYVRGAYTKKIPTKLQQKTIVDNFCKGRQYERLERQEGWLFSATKNNFEKRRQEVDRVVESKIVPNWHVFVTIFGQEIKEKVEN